MSGAVGQAIEQNGWMANSQHFPAFHASVKIYNKYMAKYGHIHLVKKKKNEINFATQLDWWDRTLCCRRRMKLRRCPFGSGALCWLSTSGRSVGPREAAVGSVGETLGDEASSSWAARLWKSNKTSRFSRVFSHETHKCINIQQYLKFFSRVFPVKTSMNHQKVRSNMKWFHDVRKKRSNSNSCPPHRFPWDRRRSVSCPRRWWKLLVSASTPVDIWQSHRTGERARGFLRCDNCGNPLQTSELDEHQVRWQNHL